MNDKIPNAANAQQVLRGAFNIDLHKLTFIEYLEVVISPEGVVEYAVPSHSEKLLAVYMRQNAITDRDDALKRLSENSNIFTSYVEMFSKETGYISVWNCGYITGCKPTQQQLNQLKTLKLNGLYHGRIDDIYTKRQETIGEFYEQILSDMQKS